jgi:hypothetical protein
VKVGSAASAIERADDGRAGPVKTETREFGVDVGVISTVHPNVKTLDDLLKHMRVDLSVWEVDKYTINKWEAVMREPATTVHVPEADANFRNQWVRRSGKPLHEPLFQVKAWLKKKDARVQSIQSLLSEIRSSSPVIRPLKKKHLPHRRALEINIVDPHIGLLCHQPEADAPWDIEMAERMIMQAIDDLVERAAPFGPFEQVFLPFGNDFVHCDTVFHETTAGTGQPEAISWHRVYLAAERIAIEMLKRLRPLCNELHVYEVPGNHSRMADFTLARLLKAYFHSDRDIHIDASSSPYKFHRYGVNLIGYEHGHSVKPIRLAALMANERPKDWSETEYREFHLGDQHRKGSSKPSMLEEQGVSVEYIPGLTAPNEWHRLKSFSHQKRGAMAFVWDHSAGPIARLQFNIGVYSHEAMKSSPPVTPTFPDDSTGGRAAKKPRHKPKFKQ